MWKWTAWFGVIGTSIVHEFKSTGKFTSFHGARQDFVIHLNSGMLHAQMPQNVCLLDVVIDMEVKDGHT